MKTPGDGIELTIKYLYMLVEQEKTALARAIHDDLGGLLITTAMDLALLKRRFAASNPDANAEIDRATRSLTAAVDMMRRVTEDLHPTLLDNVGLLAALNWLLKTMCTRTTVMCKAHFPRDEPLLAPESAIMVYRIAQEALIAAELKIDVTRIDFHLSIDASQLMMRFESDGINDVPAEGSRRAVALALLSYRAASLGGSVAVEKSANGHMHQTVHIPLEGGV